MKTAIPKPSKQSIIREARDYVMIAIGMILYGIGWTVFLLPNDITTGGVPGIASIVYWATGFPVQYTYFTINFFLLLLALKLLGLKFCIKTIFGVFTLSSERHSVEVESGLPSQLTEVPEAQISLQLS